MAQLDEVAPTGDEIEQVTLRKLVKKLGDDATKWRDAAAKTKRNTHKMYVPCSLLHIDALGKPRRWAYLELL